MTLNKINENILLTSRYNTDHFGEYCMHVGWLSKDGLTFDSTKHEILPFDKNNHCLLYTSPSPRDATLSRMPSSA